jgi:hypothetical protein
MYQAGKYNYKSVNLLLLVFLFRCLVSHDDLVQCQHNIDVTIYNNAIH